MKCKITIDGSARDAGVDKKTLKAAAEKFAALSSARIGVPFREVTIVLQHDDESSIVHEAIMGVEGATDVITQRYDPMPGEMAGVHGELYVNVEQAIRAAPSLPGWSYAKEVLLYIAHGMDHLSGANDKTPKGYSRMRRRELKWIAEFLQQTR